MRFFIKNAERGPKNAGMPYKMDTYAFRLRAERGRNACGTERKLITLGLSTITKKEQLLTLFRTENGLKKFFRKNGETVTKNPRKASAINRLAVSLAR